MEIRQVQHFLSVARHGSLSAAAVSLRITQSAVSTSLAALERDLGATLISRSAGRRSAELTPAGRAFLGPAKSLLDQVAAARAAVSAVSHSASGPVRIATTVVPERFEALRTVLELQSAHPDLHVSVNRAGSEEVIAMVTDGRVDLGLAAVSALDAPDLDIDVVLRSPLGLYCSTGHRLADADSVRVDDLLEERLIGFPRDQRIRQLMDDWLAENDSANRIAAALESGDPSAVLDIVRSGGGVTYAPMAFASEPMSTGLRAVPLLAAPAWTLAVIARRGGPTTPAAVAVHRAHLARCGGGDSAGRPEPGLV